MKPLTPIQNAEKSLAERLQERLTDLDNWMFEVRDILEENNLKYEDYDLEIEVGVKLKKYENRT